MPKFTNLIKICSISFIALNFFKVNVSAEVFDQTKQAVGLPDSSIVTSENFNLPDSIYITPLKINSEEYVSTLDWYKGLYYYQAFRLDQGDFLFHYIVSKDGDVYEANSKGEEQRIALKDDKTRPIVIAYLGGKDDVEFTQEGKQKIADLVIDIANRNRIPLDKIFAKSLQYQVSSQNEILSKFDITTGRWERDVSNIIKENSSRYNPEAYKMEVVVSEVKVPDGKVKVGRDVVIDVTLKNNSRTSLYQGNELEPIMSLVGGAQSSKFFLNGVWLGLKQVNIMTEGSSIRPGQSKTYKVRLGVPLYFEKQTEKFELVSTVGKKYDGSEFEISLDVEKPEQEVIEVQPNSLGYLNVRKEPSTSSEVLVKASPGQRFVVLEAKDGWVMIDVGGDRKGWLSRDFIKTI